MLDGVLLQFIYIIILVKFDTYWYSTTPFASTIAFNPAEVYKNLT